MYGTYFECDWCGNKAFIPLKNVQSPPTGWKTVMGEGPLKYMCRDCAEERLRDQRNPLTELTKKSAEYGLEW